MDHSGLDWELVAEVVAYRTSELGRGNAVFLDVGGEALVRSVQRMHSYVAGDPEDRPPRLNGPVIPRIESALGLSSLSIRFLAQGRIEAFLQLENPPEVKALVVGLTSPPSPPVQRRRDRSA